MALTLTYPDGGMLVTGGTGNVGSGIVRQLAKADVPLVFTYRGNSEKANALADELMQAGHRVWTQAMDMADNGSIQAALDRVVAECGSIHGMACGSGVMVNFNKLMDFRIEEIESFVNADALGYYRLFHAAVPMLRKGGGGTITTCSSIATKRVIPFDGISPISKGSVDALVRQVAAEEAEYNIRCNGVAIGWIEPRTWEQVQEETPKTVAEKPQNEMERFTALMHQFFGIVRMRRPGTPEEAGNLFAFLASEQSSFLTGQTFALDGGALL